MHGKVKREAVGGLGKRGMRCALLMHHFFLYLYYCICVFVYVYVGVLGKLGMRVLVSITHAAVFGWLIGAHGVLSTPHSCHFFANCTGREHFLRLFSCVREKVFL